MSLSKTINEVLKSPYVSNENDAHENYTRDLLIKNGFNEMSGTCIRFNYNEFWENIDKINWEKASNIPNNTIICQPFGSQKNPDKLIKYCGRLFAWEDKSSKDGKPLYNGGLPKLDCLYVFTSKKHNETTIFRGKDIISKEKRDRLLAHHEALRKLDEKFNEYEKNQEDKFNRGFIFYTRAMYDQRSSHLPKGISNDYFLHPQREDIKKKIINWITEMELTEQLEQFHITQ